MIVCSLCGTSAGGDDVPLGWVLEHDSQRGQQRTRHYCPACAREHLRSIEGKLDEAYW